VSRSFVLAVTKPSNVQNWVRVNAAGSLKAKPTESWRAYLLANSATGQDFGQLEHSFLDAAGATGKTLADKWNSYLAGIPVAGANVKEKIRTRYN